MKSSDIQYDMPVKVIKGKHCGRIGYIDDEESPYVYVHFDDFTFGRLNCTRIHVKNLESVTHLDLINRLEELQSKINRCVYSKELDYEMITL